MVSEQLLPRGISSQKILDVFKKVDRHKFVPDRLVQMSYSDSPLPIGDGQTISQPYMVALMTELLSIEKGHRIALPFGSAKKMSNVRHIQTVIL